MGCFASRGFRRLSSFENRPLLDSTYDLQFEKNYSDEFEDIRERNCELQRKMDDLRKNMDKITTKVASAEEKGSKNEMHSKTEKEKMEKTTGTLKAEIQTITDQISVLEGKLVNKIENMKKIDDEGNRNAALEGEIKKLKDRFICLEVNSLQNPVTMEDVERPTSNDELFSAIVVLTFFVGYFIGMQF